MPHFTVPAVPVAWVTGVVIVLLGLLWLARAAASATSVRSWASGLVLFVVALICWLASASSFAFVDVVGLLTSAILLAVPARSSEPWPG